MRMKTRFWMGLASIAAAALAASLLVPMASLAQGPIDAEGLFQARCKACHEPADDRAPSRSEMAQRSAADIVTALTNGPMQPMAAGMKPEEIRALSTYLSRERAGGNPLSAGAAPQAAGGGRGAAGAAGRGGPPPPPTADKMCSVNPPITPTATDWSSWGMDTRNTRFQRNPGFKAADVSKLKVKWTFSVRGGVYGQPTVVGDWLFLTLRSGDFYALDPKSGCVRWKAEVVSRTTRSPNSRPRAGSPMWATGRASCMPMTPRPVRRSGRARPWTTTHQPASPAPCCCRANRCSCP